MDQIIRGESPYLVGFEGEQIKRKRFWAIRALGSLGQGLEDKSSMRTLLTEVMADPNPEVREDAQKVLEQLKTD